MSEWNMDGKNVAIMIIIVLLLFYKNVLFYLFSALKTTGNSGVHLDGLEFPNSDDVIGVTGEQSQTISRPRQRDAVWWSGWFSFFVIGNLDLKFFDKFFLFQIPDSDGWAASGAEPVSVW
jgi:hypothetical protein